MKRILVLFFIVGISVTLNACKYLESMTGVIDSSAVSTLEETTEPIITEVTYQINDSQLNFEWINSSAYFQEYRFPNGKKFFINYHPLNGPLIICYDKENNKLWENNQFDNITVIDSYRNGIVFSNGGSVLKMDLDGKIVWRYDRSNITKLTETDDGSIYLLTNENDNKKSIIKFDSNWNVDWQKGPFSSLNIKHKDDSKILFEFTDDNMDRNASLLDTDGNELIRLNDYNDVQFLVSENSLYFYDFWNDTLSKYRLNGQLQYKLNDVDIEGFLFDYNNELVIATETEIKKLDSSGNLVYNITDLRNETDFLTSYDDGSYLVKNFTTYSKYDKDGKLLIQKMINKELTYVKTLTNGNILFESLENSGNENYLYIVDSSLNEVYQTDNFDNINSLYNESDDLVYDYSLGFQQGIIRIFNEGEIYYTKRVEHTDQLIKVDQEGKEHYLFDIYDYSNEENGFGRVIRLLKTQNNKFIINLIAVDKNEIIIYDSLGKIEFQGEFIGGYFEENIQYYYIQTENGLKEFKLSIPDGVLF